MVHMGRVGSQEQRLGGHKQALPQLRDAGPMGTSRQRKGAETSPWPGPSPRATWLSGQQSRDGPEAGSGEHHFLGERGSEREVPYRRSQEVPPSPGVRVRHWPRAGCSKKDLRQAQGLRAKADWAQGTEEGGAQKIPRGSLARGAT